MQQQETECIRSGDVVQTFNFPGDVMLVVCADYAVGQFSWVEPGASNFATSYARMGSRALAGVRRLRACTDEEHARWLEFWGQTAAGVIDIMRGSSANGCFALEGLEPTQAKGDQASSVRWWESVNERHQAELYAQIARLQERGSELVVENRTLRADLEEIRRGVAAIMGTVHGRS